MRETPRYGEFWKNNRTGDEYYIEKLVKWADSDDLELWVVYSHYNGNCYVRSLESFMGVNRNGDFRFEKIIPVKLEKK